MSDFYPMRHVFGFGPFALDPIRRVLSREGAPVQLSPKAFETLMVLVQNRGRVVDKEELLRTLWPDTVVEEINLNVQVSTLRKALGEQPNDHKFIVTVPRRGYSFVADVAIVDPISTSSASEPEVLQASEPAEPAPSRRDARLLQETPRRFGNIFAMALAVVLLLITGLPWVMTRGASGEPNRTSIAVLPFRMIAGDGQNPLGIGMTDALITRLGTIENLTVQPTASVLAYDSATSDPVRAGRELRVKTVLDGKIQTVDDRVRVTVQLLDTSDGSTIWSETFDEPSSDLFSLQDTIATQIARNLNYRLAGFENSGPRRNFNADAYAHYLRGRYHWNKRTDPDLRIAIEYHRKALAIDEDFALAYAGIADCYNLLSIYGRAQPADSYSKAREMAQKALTLDNTLAEAHTSMGYVLLRHDRDLAGAHREFERALQLNPGYATAHHWYGELLMFEGDQERSVEHLRQAERIDPLSLIIQSDLAWALYYARRYDEAEVQCNRALWLDRGFRPAHKYLALVYIQQGRYEEALSECAKVNLLESPIAGIALAKLGRVEETRALLKKYRQHYHAGDRTAYGIAWMHAALDEPEESLRWLNKSLKSNEENIQFIRIEPEFDRLREDPEFQSLIAQLANPV